MNVRAHGAKGDGVTDNTEALRAAVRAAVDRKGRYATPPFVYLPHGTYLVSGPIEGKAGEHGWSGGLRGTDKRPVVEAAGAVLSPASVTAGGGAMDVLPIAETPEFAPGSVSDIAVVTDFGATPNDASDDDADAFDAAFASGKPVVLLPNGTYHVGRAIVVRPGARLLQGTQSALGVREGSLVDPLLRFEGEGEPVTVEHLWISGKIEHAASRAVAVRHADLIKGYTNTPTGTGNVFFDDTIGKPLRIAHPQRAFGRQVNCEFGDDPLIENHGGDLWLLGFKTEGQMTVIRNVGGRVELLGGLFYPLRDVPGDVPLIISDGGAVRANYVMNYKNYPLHLAWRPNPDAPWQTLRAADIPGRGPALLMYSQPGGR